MSIDCILEKGKQQHDWALPHFRKYNEVHMFCQDGGQIISYM